jgi:hypothetical protein
LQENKKLPERKDNVSHAGYVSTSSISLFVEISKQQIKAYAIVQLSGGASQVLLENCLRS